MAKKLLILCTSHDKLGDTDQKTGLWLEELAAPFLFFKAAGYDVTVGSMKGGSIPLDETSLQPPFKTPDCDAFLANEDAVQAMQNSAPLTSVSSKDFDAVYLPGGHGVVYDMPESAQLAKLLSDFWIEDKVVSAVCHGPAGLVGARGSNGESIFKGKKVTGFSNSEEVAVGKTEVVPFLLEDKLKELGGLYECGNDWEVYAVRDGKLVTGQNPSSSRRCAELIAEALQA